MTSHVGILIVFAACVSLVFGTVMRPSLREELRLAGRLFAGLVLGAYALGWLMYLAF